MVSPHYCSDFANFFIPFVLHCTTTSTKSAERHGTRFSTTFGVAKWSLLWMPLKRTNINGLENTNPLTSAAFSSFHHTCGCCFMLTTSGTSVVRISKSICFFSSSTWKMACCARDSYFHHSGCRHQRPRWGLACTSVDNGLLARPRQVFTTRLIL